MVKKYATGYFCGLSGSLIGTILFVLIHVLLSICRNGLDVYLKFWDYPKYMLFVGVVISVIPSGLGGVFLAYLLQKNLENSTLSHKKALHIGSLMGALGVLIVFGFILITPISSVFFRMGNIGIVYLVVAFIVGISVGRWTGSSLAKLMLKENQGNIKDIV